ncbi:MAG: M43 family zinc metalloprotease [bacterium]|nr:M43 family zinc metalloprotease [bacterium]
MKKHVSTITLVLAIFTSVALFSQEKKVIRCYTDEAMEQYFTAHPEARKNFEKTQDYLKQERLAAEVANAGAKPSAVVYTVPIVFHVLHMGGPENISEASVIAAVDQINKDYARQSQDTASIFTPFKNLYIPSDIKFMLAKKDPQGNCTNGIVKHLDPKGLNWNQTAAQQPSYHTYTWDPTKYLNVYLVSLITANGTPSTNITIQGYTNLPGQNFTGSAKDVIIYVYSYIGVSFPGPDSRSLSHEIGHWLSLPHTFGNTNNPGFVCGDDGISDTPVTKGNFSTCPPSSTNTNYVCSSPNPGNPADYYQNVQNIMDYSNCARNFTSGQTNAMRTLLSSTVAGRQNLWQPANMVFTGVGTNLTCAPIAEFLSVSGSYTVCAGGNLTMKDISSNGTVTTYQWAADNMASITSSSGAQTAINFPIVGTTNVTLTVSNSQGSSSKIRTVYVLDGSAAITGPAFESFENQGLPPYWSIFDANNDGYTWQQTGQVAYDQNYCYFIDGSVLPANGSDQLIMPMMDVKNNAGNVFEFAYAFRQQTTTQNDQLKIQGSRDCGGSWQDIYNLSAATMANGSGGMGSGQFFPNPGEWKVYTISSHPNWSSYLNSSSVLVRLNFVEGSAGYGNNIFVDAVNYYNLLGVNELTKSISFSMYPNPTASGANVHFNLSNASAVKISVLDILGKEVLDVTDQTYPVGEQTISFNQHNELQKGIYFVNLSVNGATMSGKLIVQ